MKAFTSILLVSSAFAEQYSFDLSDITNPSISQPGRETFRRRLLAADCGFEGDKLVCDHGFEVETDTGDMIVVQFSARCDADSQIRFNYQRAANCQCSALVTTPDGKPPKRCPCTVCQAGFGDVPVNVDCTQYEEEYLAALANGADTSSVTSTTRSADQVTDSVVIDDTPGTAKIDDTPGTAKIDDSVAVGNTSNLETQQPITTPYVVGTCTSIDCGAACNGTCDLNCANAGTACPYCANAAQNQPTATPTGSGDGTLPFQNTSSGAARMVTMAGTGTIFLLLAGL